MPADENSGAGAASVISRRSLLEADSKEDLPLPSGGFYHPLRLDKAGAPMSELQKATFQAKTANFARKRQIAENNDIADGLALNDGAWLFAAENAMQNFCSTTRAAKRRRCARQELFKGGWC